MRLGIDVTGVAAWRAALARTPAIRTTAFTAQERAWCGEDPRAYATAWAVKEATVKLLGTGFDGIGWRGTWSRPAAGGLDVGLGDEARAVAAARALELPLRCAVHDGEDRIVALLVAGHGRVAVAAVPLPATRDRARRHGASRAAARRAGELALRRIAPETATDLRWETDARGAPRPRSPGIEAVASLAHGCGIGCAAIGIPVAPALRPSAQEPSAMVTFLYTDDLGAEVQRSMCGREDEVMTSG